MCAQQYAYELVCVCMFMGAYIYICVYICMLDICMCVYMCIYVCVYICTCHIYVYTWQVGFSVWYLDTKN